MSVCAVLLWIVGGCLTLLGAACDVLGIGKAISRWVRAEAAKEIAKRVDDRALKCEGIACMFHEAFATKDDATHEANYAARAAARNLVWEYGLKKPKKADKEAPKC